jgi:hypothetical protein
MILLDNITLLLHVLDLVLEYLNMQLELLFHLDVVADFKLVLLELRLYLLGRQVQGFLC